MADIGCMLTEFRLAVAGTEVQVDELFCTKFTAHLCDSFSINPASEITVYYYYYYLFITLN